MEPNQNLQESETNDVLLKLSAIEQQLTEVMKLLTKNQQAVEQLNHHLKAKQCAQDPQTIRAGSTVIVRM
jgi:hypothetical protein